MRQHEVLELLQQRAQRYVGRRRLVVDYYRIRRRVAYPWPLAEMPRVGFRVSGMESYPWQTWFSWCVEERVNAMGWAAEIGGDEGLRARVREEVAGVARWPGHASGGPLDLCFGHLMRMLVMARRNWAWLGEEVEAEICAACGRAVEQKRGWMGENLGKFADSTAILATEDPDHLTRNIPLIGAIALALAAAEVGDGEAEAVRRYALMFMEARLELQGRGSSEDVAYDGYVLDFFADLVPLLTVKEREGILGHAGILRTLAMSWQLAAPGDVVNVAALGDTEPREMTFHVSAQAKLGGMMRVPESLWYLGRVRLEWLRSEALGVMWHLPEEGGKGPSEEVAVGPYAVTLRTGWDADDTAVAIGAPRGGMGHLHCDGGSILIGRGGTWLIADPGYQQYLDTSERGFTLGVYAHNGPVVNGHVQEKRATRVVEAGVEGGVRRVVLDLTGNYSAAAGVTGVRRTVWLLTDGTVVVGDRIAGKVEKIGYTFHGVAGGSWWAEGGKAVIYYQGAELWVASPTVGIGQEQITRLKGSRGQESVVCEMAATGGKAICWWIFNIGTEPIGYGTSVDSITLGGLTLLSRG